MWKNFKYSYTYFPCWFKRNIPEFLYSIEEELYQVCKKTYDQHNTELVSFEKVGFNKYLVVYKIHFQNELNEVTE